MAAIGTMTATIQVVKPETMTILDAQARARELLDGRVGVRVQHTLIMPLTRLILDAYNEGRGRGIGEAFDALSPEPTLADKLPATARKPATAATAPTAPPATAPIAPPAPIPTPDKS